MSVLCAPTASPAVQDYRFKKPPLGQTIYEGSVDDDLIVWLGEHGMEWDGFWTNAYSQEAQAIAAVMRQYDIPVIVDVDDHFSELPEGNCAIDSWRFRKKKLYTVMLEEADRRVCSTPFLAEQHDCEIAPNFVTEEEWDWPKRKRDDGEVVLLHCGSVNRAEDYLKKEEAFRAFLEQPNTKVVFMGWMPKWAKDYENGKVVFCRWVEHGKYQRMVRWLAPDLVVSPLEHNNFNLAKSNIKWLEAGMAEACFVGERWGEYLRTVGDGGVLADSDSEWEDVLVDLAQDHGKRREIAAKGREMVLKDWTWPAVKGQWEKAVLGVHDGTGIERVAGRREQHSAAAG